MTGSVASGLKSTLMTLCGRSPTGRWIIRPARIPHQKQKTCGVSRKLAKIHLSAMGKYPA